MRTPAFSRASNSDYYDCRRALTSDAAALLICSRLYRTLCACRFAVGFRGTIPATLAAR